MCSDSCDLNFKRASRGGEETPLQVWRIAQAKNDAGKSSVTVETFAFSKNLVTLQRHLGDNSASYYDGISDQVQRGQASFG